jgi:spermidine/putrescine transport system ATP-binding protein
MNVRENMAFALKMRKVPKAEIDERVQEAARILGIEKLLERKPKQLSGGQRQRVAIARSLILSPRILLLDEPLGALDLQLRRQMQVELKRMQQKLGITFIYITHDQEEALLMSDRVALMRGGRFVQVDTPRELYERPQTAFAASFIGETNLIAGRAAAVKEGEVLLDIAGFTLPCESNDWITPGEDLLLCVRAERMHLSSEPLGTPCRLKGELIESHYAGGDRTYLVRLPDGQTVRARHSTENDAGFTLGRQVYCWWNQPSGILVRDDREENP